MITVRLLSLFLQTFLQAILMTVFMLPFHGFNGVQFINCYNGVDADEQRNKENGQPVSYGNVISAHKRDNCFKTLIFDHLDLLFREPEGIVVIV